MPARVQEALEQLMVWRAISKGAFPHNVPQYSVPYILEAVMNSGEYILITREGW